MIECDMFDVCNAPLCPLDKDIDKRCWYSDEEVCKSRKHGAGIRWISKQRSIQRRQTKAWLDRPVKHQELVDKSKKRKLSQESLDKLASIREKALMAKKIKD